MSWQLLCKESVEPVFKPDMMKRHRSMDYMGDLVGGREVRPQASKSIVIYTVSEFRKRTFSDSFKISSYTKN